MIPIPRILPILLLCLALGACSSVPSNVDSVTGEVSGGYTNPKTGDAYNGSVAQTVHFKTDPKRVQPVSYQK